MVAGWFIASRKQGDRLVSSFCGTAQVIFNQSLRIVSWGVLIVQYGERERDESQLYGR